MDAYNAVKDFQTLFSACVALLAAGIAYFAATHSAQTASRTQTDIALKQYQERREDRALRRRALTEAIRMEARHIQGLCDESLVLIGSIAPAGDENIRGGLTSEERKKAVRYSSMPERGLLRVGWESLALLDPPSQTCVLELTRQLDELTFLVNGLEHEQTRLRTVTNQLSVVSKACKAVVNATNHFVDEVDAELAAL